MLNQRYLTVAVQFVVAFLCCAGIARSADTEPETKNSVAASDHVAGPSNEQAGFRRLWRIGTLDPTRNKQWPTQSPGTNNQLATVAIQPRFVQFIARGNPENPSNIDCYEVPELLEGKPFSPRFGGGERTRLTLLVDLGRTMPGTIEFQAEVPVGTKMSIETGEAMLPTRTYTVGPEANAQRQSFRPVIAHGGWGSMRFAWIHFDNPTGPIVVHQVHGLCQLLPCDYVGSFECSDDELTRIWEMCAYSVHAVMGQPLENGQQASGRLQTLCLDRVDRFPWAGDSRVIQTAVMDVFGQYSLVRSNLEGFLPKGTRPIPDLTGIAPYTLDWALAAIDYFQCSGDSEFLKERLDDLMAILDKYDSLPIRWKDIQQPAGQDIWMFFDWDDRIARTIDAQTAAAFAGKYVQACREVARTAEALDRRDIASRSAKLADQHTKQWRAMYLRQWRDVYGIHAVTNLLLGDMLFTADERTEAFNKVFSDRRKRWTNTPYFGSHILTALARIDRHPEAIEMLHDYWGSMIDAGATTVWEEWSPNMQMPVNSQPPQFGPPCTWGGASLIQPAGVGPARWLTREVLGVSPAIDGFKHVRIEPHRVGLTWARGTVATPQGPVRVDWKDEPSQFELHYEVPVGCESVAIEVPAGMAYKMDGQDVEPKDSHEGQATFGASAGSHVLVVAK